MFMVIDVNGCIGMVFYVVIENLLLEVFIIGELFFCEGVFISLSGLGGMADYEWMGNEIG